VSRRRKPALSLPPDWIEHAEATVNGRILTRGTEVSIRGERGRFRFLRAIERPEHGLYWLEFWGGPRHSEQWRSFYPERVRRVHRIKTTDKALVAARKEAA
jgi:hypothetical protein